MNFLTLGQLREDLAALDAFPACLPTNVTALLHERGEIIADGDDSTEEELRKELEEANDLADENSKETKVALEQAEKAQAEAKELREEMELLVDPTDQRETVASYRERALLAEQRTQQYQEYMADARHKVSDTEAELKALRARKGAAPGVCRHSHEIMTLLRRLNSATLNAYHHDAARLLSLIEPKEDPSFT